MVFKLRLPLLIWLGMMGCKTREKESTYSDIVSGTYVHTYTAEVIEPATGEVMGTRTVRDTLFISESGGKFEVSNRRWLFNDYDTAGWVTPESKADQAMPTYFVEYDRATKKLTPSPAEKKYPSLYVDGEKIYWGDEKALEYNRVDEE